MRFLVPPSVGVSRAQARGELLQRALTQELGEPVRVEVAEDYASLAEDALAGRAELVWAPAAVCAELEERARAVFRVVRHGRSTYRSALVARRADRLSLTRLGGTRAAWVDPLSLGGGRLVLHHLRKLGIDPDATFGSQAYLGTHPAALAAVIERSADVAALSVDGPLDEHVVEALELHGGRVAATELALITVTDAAPNDALVLTDALDASRAEALLDRVFPRGEPTPRPRSLCLAMEAEAFERARPGEYAALRAILSSH